MTTIGVTNVWVIILRFTSLLICNVSKKIYGLFFRRERAEKNSSGWSL